MWQAISIDSNVPLDAGDFFAAIITFFFGSIGILDTLSINDQKSGARPATMVLSDLAN
jgi:hypothetical protein